MEKTCDEDVDDVDNPAVGLIWKLVVAQNCEPAVDVTCKPDGSECGNCF